LRETTVEHMVTNIHDQKIYDEAHEVLDRLKEEIDDETIMFKLLSMIIDKQEIKGPSNIGIPAEKLAAILERASKRNDNGRGGRSRGGYRGNRNRSNSSSRNRSAGSRDRNSSGYRGNRGSSSKPRHRG